MSSKRFPNDLPAVFWHMLNYLRGCVKDMAAKKIHVRYLVLIALANVVIGRSFPTKLGTSMKTEQNFQPKDTLVDLKTVCATLCRSRASIYRDIKRGDFPPPHKLGGSSRWLMSDLNNIVNPTVV